MRNQLKGSRPLRVAELSMDLVVRLTPPQTMKVKEVISGQEVVVLIDCRATHNFVSAKSVQKLGLLRIDTTGYEVIMSTRILIQVWECARECYYPSKTLM